ncbi:hypothetical protein LR48_Vigan10g117700 [Vigna angularis]|uniref:Uncharacterized protein n=1 Tax=Phaseolus angularis TaxID=3914 RepID=A0A0L9VJQ5_PHAAN|nr:hypothetical protein LR48_Vigan10g117700 [Vigna angularis]
MVIGNGLRKLPMDISADNTVGKCFEFMKSEIGFPFPIFEGVNPSPPISPFSVARRLLREGFLVEGCSHVFGSLLLKVCACYNFVEGKFVVVQKPETLSCVTDHLGKF